MRRIIFTVMFAASAGLLAACQPTEPAKPPVPPVNAPSPASPAPSASPTVDPKAPNTQATKLASLEGEWPGKEGSTLSIQKKGDKFAVELRSAGKSESYEGVEKGGTIEFKRKDKVEVIRAAKPEETGMNWPGGEKACVVINKGTEAFCRK